MDHYQPVREAVTELMRERVPCPDGKCKGCANTGIDPRFIREGINGEYAVIVVRAAR